MRRSRRSLSLLLGMMAVSLAVVRATTQPALEARRNSTGVLAPAGAGIGVQREGGDERGDLSSPHCAPARSLLGDPSERPTEVAPPGSSQLGQQTTPRSPRPVSASAVIVVIPGPGEVPEPRVGWSGCEAYAVGCDHLGRYLTDGKDDQFVGALSSRRF